MINKKLSDAALEIQDLEAHFMLSKIFEYFFKSPKNDLRF